MIFQQYFITTKRWILGELFYTELFASYHFILYLCPQKTTKKITKEYDEDDIICEDADGDGYYFWGIGPKPSTCPEYAMYLPDFDDSNPFIGSINSNGIIENINPEERDTIDLLNISFIEYDHHCYNHLVLLGGEYTDMIYDIYFHNGAKIFLRSGSELTLRECILYNVE